MKTIEVDEDLYRYIAGRTEHIGESASDILRRLLNVDCVTPQVAASPASAPKATSDRQKTDGLVVSKDAARSETIDGVKVMRSLLISDEFAASNKAVDRFMQVLSSLYQINNTSFAEATQVRGRTRIYFADNEAVLLASGKTTKPRLIPDTPFWVITNNNTDRKRQMVDQLMSRMGFQSDLIEKVCGAI